jgi:riboflavin synthase
MELPLTMNSLLSGHLVQGHVDGVINLKTIDKLDSELWNFTFSNASNKYLVDKGSITINGISLTVVEPFKDTFTVSIIEETFNRTNLKHLNVDDTVNVEYDIVIKYLEKLNYDN